MSSITSRLHYEMPEVAISTPVTNIKLEIVWKDRTGQTVFKDRWEKMGYENLQFETLEMCNYDQELCDRFLVYLDEAAPHPVLATDFWKDEYRASVMFWEEKF